MNGTPSSPEAAAAPLSLGGMQDTIFATPPAMRLTPLQTAELARVAAPFLSRVFSDACGNPSSLRVVMVLGFAAVAGAWAYLSIRIGALQDVPMTVIYFLVLLMGGKLYQNGQEPETPRPTPPALIVSSKNSATQPGAAGLQTSPAAPPPSTQTKTASAKPGGADGTAPQATPDTSAA